MVGNTTKRPDKDQKQRFIDKARELEADEDEVAFRERLKRIAKASPPKPKGKERE